MSEDGKIESFTDLKVWKEGHKPVVMVYKVTRSFPTSGQTGTRWSIR